MRPRNIYHQPVLFTLVCLSVLIASQAHASVSVLLEQPYGWFSHISPSGHTAVYLDHVCADTPLHLRVCRPGEFGVVISRYDKIGDHDWVAVPLTGYLYAVQTPQEIPARVTKEDVNRLRGAYRHQTLSLIAPDLPNGSEPPGNWYELAGASYNRTIYGFEVNTTPEQDAELITYLNDSPNHAVFNGMLRNCADFVRLTVNRYYPHAIGRNYVAGLGVSSPKSVARSLAHYARKHPETGMRMFKITQVPGDFPRSHSAVTLMEGISKEFGIPIFFLSPYATGAVVTAWLTQGRFAEPKHAPELNLRPDVTIENAWNLTAPFSPVTQAEAPRLEVAPSQ